MLKKSAFCLLLWFCIVINFACAQRPAPIEKNTNQHFFTRQEIDLLPDTTNQLTIADVSSTGYQSKFKRNPGYYPKNLANTTCWYRIKIKFADKTSENSSIIEFFDQTTNRITAYMPKADGSYNESRTGSDLNFANRLFAHKNFEFKIGAMPPGEYSFYFKVKSTDVANVIMVYRKQDYFLYYALTEYLTYGLFYGIILIFSFHHLLMFMAIKKRQYIYYVLYILSVGFYEMSIDGIAFQYVWPNLPQWNQYAYGIALFSLSFFALQFTKELLHVKTLAPRLHKLINYVIILRTLYFLYCLTLNQSLFYYKFLEFIPLSIAFITGITVWANGFKPARFFVLGYTLLTIGFIIKALTVLGFTRLVPGIVSNYSLSVCFVFEMFFLSFSMGDQIRLLRKAKEKAQEENLKQLQLNFQLKDSINRELENKVAERTVEVTEKSEKIRHQAEIIEQQNQKLTEKNKQLELQSAEILGMNILLENDNQKLKGNIEKVTDAWALSAELSFEEFSLKYPDQEKCNKFLADLKWANNYTCIKCSSNDYKPGRALYSRRCTKCNYEESVLFNTIFQNNRIPINKAFYIVYLIYTTKGNISSYQLSDRLQIRQSTCWQYAIRVKKLMDERRIKNKKNINQGWSSLILNSADYRKISLVREKVELLK